MKEESIEKKLDNIVKFLQIQEANRTRQESIESVKKEKIENENLIKKTWRTKKVDIIYQIFFVGIFSIIAFFVNNKYQEISQSVEIIKNLNQKYLYTKTFIISYENSYASKIKLIKYLKENEIITSTQMWELLDIENESLKKINNEIYKQAKTLNNLNEKLTSFTNDQRKND